MKKIAVFCGSSSGKNPIYSSVAKDLAELFIANGHTMITGGGKVGIMGVLADEMIRCSGKVTGVIPGFLVDKEVAHEGLNEIIIVDTMHARKQKIEQMADGSIALPGGFGTLDEIFEIITWAQLSIHKKPCGILNVNGFFDNIIQHIHHMIQEGFVHKDYLNMLIIESEPEILMNRMMSFVPKEVDKAEIALGEKNE